MSDARLRGQARAAGDPEAAAALLRARQRSGELPTWRLELAAYCGDANARQLLPDAVQGPPEPNDWAWGLARWGKPVLVRAGVLAARAVAAEVEVGFSHEGLPAVIEAAADWSEEPSEERAQEAHLLLLRLGRLSAFLPLAAVAHAISQPLHGLDQDAVRSVGYVLRIAESAGVGPKVRAGLAAWALGE
ncbi:MAG: hypothetical protein AB7N76_18740 [Planctomycetota bacterium]